MSADFQLVPSLAEQHRLVTFVNRYIAELLDETRERDATTIARRFFLYVTKELGEVFWAKTAAHFRTEGQIHLSGEPDRNGLVPALLTSDQLTDCTRAFWEAVLLRIPCVSAVVREYCHHLRHVHNAPSLGACVEEFLSEKASERIRSTMLAVYRRHLNAPLSVVANVPPSEVSRDRIDQLLMSCPSRGVRDERHRVFYTLFRWCVQKRYVMQNPVPKLQKPAPIRFIFSPCQVREILRLASKSDQLAYWALAFFAGLRHSELQQLGRMADPWKLFRASPLHFELPSEVTSKTPRLVQKTSQCATWTDWLSRRSLPVFPKNWSERLPQVWRTVLARHPDVRHRRARPYSSLPPKPNGMTRSTYIAYRVARGDSIDAIAFDAGLTRRRVEMFSPVGVDPRRVRDYFSISPDCLGGTLS